MMSFLQEDSPLWYQTISQLLAGIGVGCVFGARIVAVQAAVPRNLIAVAVAMTSFFQQLGSVLGIATCGALFNSYLVTFLAEDLPDLNPLLISNNPQNVKLLPSNLRVIAIHDYVKAIDTAWKLSIAFAIVVFISSLFIKDVSSASPLLCFVHVLMINTE